MAVGIGGAAPGALANVFAGLALVAPGAARVWPAALAAAFLLGLATIPPAHGGTPAEEAALEAAMAKFDAAEAAAARDPANICAAHEIPDKTASPSGVREPAFQQPCAELYAKQVAAWNAARAARDAKDLLILRDAGLPVPPH
jgi:hypothetical protein